MKYIIMCGGQYTNWDKPRQLLMIKGETLIARTIRLLKENGAKDIFIPPQYSISGVLHTPETPLFR